MPSPFPGMDPYLEGSLWMSVQTPLMVEIVRQLTPKLRPRYIALTKRRFISEAPEDDDGPTSDRYPDATAVYSGLSDEGKLPTKVVPPTFRMQTLLPESLPQVSVEIRDTKNRQRVAVIDVLTSPNKQGSERDSYLAKRSRVLLSPAHLLEIDFLREGQRVPMKDPLPQVPYFVYLSRSDERPFCSVWPIALNQALPTVPVPLSSEDPDVTLDLQEALASVYDSCGFDMAVDYSQPPEVSLSAPAMRWAEDRLRTARLRP